MPPHTKWTEEEDHTLLRVYTTVADELNGDEKHPSFWTEVHVALYSDYLQEPRKIGALQARWQLISKHVAYFAECIGHLAACEDAEEDDENEELISDALTLFNKTSGHRFRFLHCWEYLKTWPKFKLLRVISKRVRRGNAAVAVLETKAVRPVVAVWNVIKLLWKRKHPEMEIEWTEEEEKNRCNCLQVNDGFGEEVEGRDDVAEKRERLRRLKRATGLPSSDNIFRKKITSRFGSEEIERDFDDGEEGDTGVAEIAPTASEALPRSIARNLLGSRNPPPYHPLFRSEGCSLLETIEPRNEPMRTMHEAALVSCATQQEVNRGLDNLVYEIDRTNNMPPDDLVDFLVYAASVKVSDVSGLIGTFEDSAAVAASIIVEEYMTQLVDDFTTGTTSLCAPTESSVVAFTQELLTGFNWSLFSQQHPEPKQDMIDHVAALVLREFISVQPQTWDLVAHADQVMSWIRKAVVIPNNEQQTSVRISNEELGTTEREEADEESKIDEGAMHSGEGVSRPVPRVRMSVKPHPVFGTPTYNLSYSSTLEDGHHVETSVGGIKSKSKANATIDRLSKAVASQDQRSKNAPPPPSDPYRLMWDFLNQHIVEYKSTRPESDGEEPEEETALMKRSRARKRQKLKLQEEIAARNRLLNPDAVF
ncbi:hypothetical protein PHYBOEH_000039 [Phytophthora boehmeriae]|uniref:Uncharacterized protein n=1 Tax=Phytophthora boehmeriae TaxID=109152 RepID=A0A8T1X9E6_9STRA|nr:hypothetical protein PHYBOEH_000039 [Phytophthora boehmeriae]